jgi:hypothetical protein
MIYNLYKSLTTRVIDKISRLKINIVCKGAVCNKCYRGKTSREQQFNKETAAQGR